MSDNVSFGIISIESIWPSPFDKAGRNADISKRGVVVPEDAYYNSGEKKSLRVGASRYHSYVEPTDSIRRGYYIIVALNIISASTSSDVGGGNSFDAEFTTEKLVFISEDSGHISSEELIKSIVTQGSDVIAERPSSISDVLMNVLSRSNIQFIDIPIDTGNFNIKDIVEPGDTVSIWLYNDPKVLSMRLNPEGIISKHDDLAPIAGNFTRKSFSIESDDVLDSAVISASSLTSKAQSNTIAAAQSKAASSVSYGDVIQAALAIALKAGQYKDEGGNRDQAVGYVRTVSEDVNGIRSLSVDAPDLIGYYLSRELSKESYFSGLSKFVTYEKGGEKTTVTVNKGNSENTATQEQTTTKAKYVYTSNSEGNNLLYFILLCFQLSSIVSAQSNIDSAIYRVEEKFVGLKGLEFDTTENRPAFFEDAVPVTAAFRAGYYILKKYLEGKLKDEQSKLKNEVTMEPVKKGGNTPTFQRAFLYTKTSGDSPYLVMRGHIKTVSATFGSNNSTMRIAGSGFEYPMEKHMIFFDTGITYSARYTSLQDYATYYAHLSPPQTITAIILKWMPKKVKWGPLSQSTSTMNALAGIEVGDRTNYILRGSAIHERNTGEVLGNNPKAKDPEEAQIEKAELIRNDTRVFTPLNYVDIERLGEFTRAIIKADSSGLLASTTLPTSLSSNDTIFNAVRKIGAVGNIYEMFVDETGKLVYRVTMEAWERTPNPAYTPSVDDVLRFTDTESEEAIFTMINVQATANSQVNGGVQELTQAGFGRAIPRPSELPFPVEYENVYPNLFSPELFKYGLRVQDIADPYGSNGQVMRPKAYNLIRFYKDPLKKAEVSVGLDPTYRKGNTVFVCLPSRKTRSKAVIHIQNTIDWMNSFAGDATNLERYLGIESRFVGWGNFYSVKNNPIHETLSPLSKLTHQVIHARILRTLEFLKNMNFTTITPDIFPTTLWYYLEGKGAGHDLVVQAHKAALRTIRGDNKAIEPDLIPYLRYIKFNNFLSRQYYIERVSHSYSDGTGAETNLNLSYGQDCLTIMHPLLDLSLGFMSVERKLKDGFYEKGHKGAGDVAGKTRANREGDAGIKQNNVEEYEIPADSSWRKLQREQFIEDKAFKASSIVYEGARVRNSAIFIHNIITRSGVDDAD